MLTGKKFGRYELGPKIGEGGMGEVYSAVDTELGRSVAVKLLPAEFTEDADRRRRFKQEARVISALNHPNIITIYEIGENEYGSFLTTEFVEGRTLREVARSESLTIAKILRIIEQTANALVAAHAAGIVHRDIKPENVMVRSDSIVKVLDFGLAKPREVQLDEAGNKTLPGTVMGSARYMSPEQARGREVDERTDIWSLGVILYELLTGRAPFDGDTTADTLANVIHKEPEPLLHLLPNLPVELQRITRKALQKDRDERYQSMKDLALDIKDLLYSLEHANSGDRMGTTTSLPRFDENPTMMINTTSGANHPTSSGQALTRISAPFVRNRSARGTWIAAFAAIAVIGAIALGAFTWLGGTGTEMAAAAFEKNQMSRVNTDGRVLIPAISPDGKYVAYISGDLGSRSLVVRQIATDSVVTVVPQTNLNFSAVSFSPSGDHVFYCETRSDFSLNTLYQVPTLGGPSKKLIEDVDSAVTFSPDGKRLAFMRHVTDTNEDVIFTADLATLRPERVSSSKQAGFDFFTNRIAWSPDGERILIGAGNRSGGTAKEMTIGAIFLADGVFKPLNTDRFFSVNHFMWFSDGSGFLFAARETPTAPVQIWRASYPGLEFSQVTNDFSDYSDVGLSSDGVTVVALRAGINSSLWRTTPGAGEPVQLTGDGRSPEGTLGLLQMPSGQLLYSRRDGKESKFWIADADGKNPKQIGPEEGSGVSPAVTPDGRYIVFNLQKVGSSRIWRMDADGRNPIQLSDENPERFDFNPQLTADGNTVVFHRTTHDDRSALMTLPLSGGQAVKLYSEENRGTWGPRLSGDGRRIAFTAYDMKTFERKVVVATLNGSTFGQIEREFEYNLINQMHWAPDGKGLTFLTSRAGTPNLWNQPIDGSEAKPITEFKSGQIFNFSWSLDGKSLLLARGSLNNELILIRDTRRVERNTAQARPGLTPSKL